MSSFVILPHQELESNLEIIKDTGEILKDRSATGRERPWSERKMENLQLVNLFEMARRIDPYIISESRLEQVRDCASWLKFAVLSDKKRKLVKANFCRLRLCPMCSWRKSLKLFSQVSKITDAILRDKKARFIFLTLTVKNVSGEELRAKIQEMNEAFKWIIQKSRTSAISKKFKDYVMGYMKAVEVTYNHKTDTFHPHFHIILELKPSYFDSGYLTQKQWRDMWKEVMHLGYDPQVDVRIIKNATAKAVAEVSKYPVKLKGLLELAPEQAVEPLIKLKRALQDLRMITFGGDFREYKKLLQLDDVENGDLVHIETEKNELNAVAMMLFKYRADVGAYVC